MFALSSRPHVRRRHPARTMVTSAAVLGAAVWALLPAALIPPGSPARAATRVPLAAALATAPHQGAGGAPAAAGQTSAPPSLVFSTYLGGRDWDEATAIKADAGGNIYVTGFTLSANFPIRRAAQSRFGGLSDAFVTKLAPDGHTLLWSTYLGGSDVDIGNSLALDSASNVYVTGMTASADFPTTSGSLQPTIRNHACQGEPCHDAFVTKLSPTGRILYSTYLGGSVNDEGVGIAVDAAGSAYVTGNTDSPDFPTRRAVQPTFGSLPCQGDIPCSYDVFVSKLTPNGQALDYSTYLGGSALDISGGIAVDAAGSAYITGSTRSPNFPTTRSALQPVLKGRACGPPPGEPCLDAFVTKLAVGGDRIVYSTYLGGAKNDRGIGIAVDAAGNALVTGSTQSADFPTLRAVQARLDNRSCTSDQPQEQCDDAFVTKIGGTGNVLVYSTYLGGQAEDQGLAVVVDTAGNAYVAGRTDSRNFPIRTVVQPRFGGYIDGFVTKLAADGALQWSTFLGGSKADRSRSVAVDAAGGVYLTGRTLSADFPTKQPVQSTLGGDDYDAFVTKLR